MRILHAFISYPSGYQPYNDRLLHCLIANGLDVRVAAFGNQRGPVPVEIRRRIVYVNLTGGRLIRFMKAIPRLLLLFRFYGLLNQLLKERPCRDSIRLYLRFVPLIRLNPSVIHIHHIQLLNDDFLLFLRFLNKPWVISVRGFDVMVNPLLHEENPKRLQEVFRECYGVHCVCEFLKNRAIELGCEQAKIKVIYRSIKVETIQRRQVSKKPLTLTSIGRLAWEKGLVYSLEALKALVDQGYEVEYFIVGSGPDEQLLRFRAWQLDVEAHVRFCGYLSTQDIDRILSHTDLILHTSLYEGLPNSLLEAQAKGIPAVGTNVGGIPEVIIEGKTGLLSRVADPEHIAECVKQIVSDARTLDFYRENITKLNRPEFDPSREAMSYREFYQQASKRV